MRRVAYIIPGWGESFRMKSYRNVCAMFKARGVTPIPVRIDWKRKVMTQYIDQFSSVYGATHKAGDVTYLWGFSYGAIISFVAAAKIKPRAVFLCSLSPFFKEDLKYNLKSWKSLVGKRAWKDLKVYSFNATAKQFHSRAIIFVGENE